MTPAEALARLSLAQREVVNAADYLIEQLWACYLGTRVRDLDEAQSRYVAARAKLSLIENEDDGRRVARECGVGR